MPVTVTVLRRPQTRRRWQADAAGAAGNQDGGAAQSRSASRWSLFVAHRDHDLAAVLGTFEQRQAATEFLEGQGVGDEGPEIMARKELDGVLEARRVLERAVEW